MRAPASDYDKPWWSKTRRPVFAGLEGSNAIVLAVNDTEAELMFSKDETGESRSRRLGKSSYSIGCFGGGTKPSSLPLVNHSELRPVAGSPLGAVSHALLVPCGHAS